jgi:hypothetical protein
VRIGVKMKAKIKMNLLSSKIKKNQKEVYGANLVTKDLKI